MPITQTLTDSFRIELFQGVHNFSNPGGHTFKLALYTSSATLGANTTVYTTSGEVVGTGYVAGGNTLTSVTPIIVTTPPGSNAVVLDFADTTWANSTITARGALLYNATAGNKAIAVFDFGTDRVTNNTPFQIIFPTPDAISAVIRLL